MSSNSRYTNLRENPDTARAGMPWTTEEDAELMERVTSKMDMENIAKAHNRTISGIRSRIMTNAMKMMETNNMSMEDVSKHVRVPLEELLAHKQKQKRGKPKDGIPKTSSHPINMQDDKYMQILIEIRDLLKDIAGSK